MFVVFRAPDWAEGKDRPSGDAVPPGTWKPNPRAFGRFAQALGKRYTGHYNGLPRVHYFEVWTRRLGAGPSTRSASGGGASPAPISATPRTSCQASACRPRLLGLAQAGKGRPAGATRRPALRRLRFDTPSPSIGMHMRLRPSRSRRACAQGSPGGSRWARGPALREKFDRFNRKLADAPRCGSSSRPRSPGGGADAHAAPQRRGRVARDRRPDRRGRGGDRSERAGLPGARRSARRAAGLLPLERGRAR
jgi:hypothetical protein